MEIVKHKEFSLQTFLSSERQQIQWQGEGLPTDQLSIQNAIIILKVSARIGNFRCSYANVLGKHLSFYSRP